MIHQLKIRPKYFEDIANGLKTFEVRKNDRYFQVGDYIGLNELATAEKFGETGRFILAKVVYIFEDKNFLQPGYVILGIQPCTVLDKGIDTVQIYDEC